MHAAPQKLLIFAVAFLALALPASAHEADQFTYPPGREFADVGLYLTRYFYDAIDRGVNSTNQQIKSALEAGRSKEARELQSPQALAQAVNREFPVALFLIEHLDKNLPKPESREHYPGRIVLFKPSDHVRKYVDIPLSPFNAWRCGTFNAFGTSVGADKIGHFTDMGMHYYREYQDMRAKGASEEQATAAALKLGTDDPITSESGLLGWATAGAYSNADLIANYTGMLFYRNLGEQVYIKGAMRDPMCVVENNYWRLSPRLHRDGDFYSLFISDHLNEALNPSFYVKNMREPIAKAIRERSTGILEEYVDRFGNRRSESWFRTKAKDLSTYYGVNYGHRGGDKDLMNIADLCFGKQPDAIDKRDTAGRTPLHIAAERNDLKQMQHLVERGADVNARVRSKEERNSDWGNTPLHAAARDGNVEAARYLISRGADVNAANDRGVTPLHLASHHAPVAEALILAGAKLESADVHGRTPLQWAAYDPEDAQARVLGLLLTSGANVNVKDSDGQTALAYAASAANSDAAFLLVKSGADVNAANNFGVTPLHLAAGAASPQMVDLLIRAHSRIDAIDDFGCTALHDATRSGGAYAVALLLRSGSNPKAADSYGHTPLHLAGRHGRSDIATMLLNQGADIFARSDSGAMAIDEAERAGATGLVQMLRGAALKAMSNPLPSGAVDGAAAAAAHLSIR